MLIINKRVGETPLQLLDRVRIEKPELKEEKLSYAGRLDPMAEGKMLILVGGENNNREEFLGLDTEYVAKFVIGVKTDTGDILGLLDSLNLQNVEVTKESVEKQVLELKKIKEQKYPWFSSQTVDGVKLFDHYKAGNFDIERPSRSVQIKEVELTDFTEQNSKEIKKYIFESIGKVSGDFRQSEIIKSWQSFFTTLEEGSKMLTFEIKILVSSGTYIRALTENFDFKTTLINLNRTKIGDII